MQWIKKQQRWGHSKSTHLLCSCASTKALTLVVGHKHRNAHLAAGLPEGVSELWKRGSQLQHVCHKSSTPGGITAPPPRDESHQAPRQDRSACYWRERENGRACFKIWLGFFCSVVQYLPPDCSKISSSKGMFENELHFCPVPFIYELCHFVGNNPRCSCMRHLSRINHFKGEKKKRQQKTQKARARKKPIPVSIARLSCCSVKRDAP